MALNGNTVEERIWNYLYSKIKNPYGVAGLMGNLYAESGLIFNRVEILCLKRLKENGKAYTDATYTKAIDKGTISKSEFLNPLPGKQYGYGLCQWTSPSRKSGLYDLAKSKGKSIANESIQLQYLIKELKSSYVSVWNSLKKATSIKEASDIVLKKFEIPADTGTSMQLTRASYGQKYYDMFVSVSNNSSISVIEKAISWMENTANDDSHGYCQEHRWGADGDYDCSSAVITAWEQAGVPLKSNGATYTGNLYSVAIKLGFKDVTSSVGLSTGSGLIRGDILLNHANHVAMYCGNGKEVEASINEHGGVTGGQPGDQTGKEFLIKSYRNYPWDCVLRYEDNKSNASTNTSSSLSTKVKWYGTVDTGDDTLNVRSWAGIEYDLCSFSPLNSGETVGVCDSVEASDGSTWHFILYDGKYGFVHGDYICK